MFLISFFNVCFLKDVLVLILKVVRMLINRKINKYNLNIKRLFFNFFKEKPKDEIKYTFIRKKELEFMSNELINCNYLINEIERYYGQDMNVFNKVIESSCIIAQDYLYPLIEVYFYLFFLTLLDLSFLLTFLLYILIYLFID